MAVKDDIRCALQDAIEWQKSLAAVYQKEDPEKGRALRQIDAYRKILNRRYGDGRSISEKIGNDLSKLEIVSIYDVQKMHNES